MLGSRERLTGAVWRGAKFLTFIVFLRPTVFDRILLLSISQFLPLRQLLVLIFC